MASRSVRRRHRVNEPLHLRKRLKTLRKRIRQWRADGLLVTNPRDIRYLTGFIGDDSWALVLARSSKVHVISDGRFEQQIQREAPHAVAHMRKKGLSDELVAVNERLGLRRIALQSAHVTIALRKVLEKKLGRRRITAVDDGLIKQRAIKDKAEVGAIRQAGAIQQEAFRRVMKKIRSGLTEQQIAAMLEYEMRVLGADGACFATIVAAGANASLPHALPGATKVKRGGIVLIDWGARYHGYCADMTRVVALGRMPAKIKQIYQIVLDAQLAAIDTIKPGQRLRDIDAVARRVIDKAGYGDRFGHGLGHGLGLDIHEAPVLAARATGVLEPGHVVTVEPGVYLPGVGGVRIEDDVLVTARGRRVLTDLPKSLESAII